MKKKTTRKRKRSVAACKTCRERHVKCDGGNPCGRCKKRNLKCVFSTPRKRGPQKGHLESVTGEMKTLQQALRTKDDELSRWKALYQERVAAQSICDSTGLHLQLSASLATYLSNYNNFYGQITSIFPCHDSNQFLSLLSNRMESSNPAVMTTAATVCLGAILAWNPHHGEFFKNVASQMLRMSFDECHPQVAASMCLLGTYYQAKGQLSKSRHYLGLAHSTCQLLVTDKHIGETEPDTLQLLTMMQLSIKVISAEFSPTKEVVQKLFNDILPTLYTLKSLYPNRQSLIILTVLAKLHYFQLEMSKAVLIDANGACTIQQEKYVKVLQGLEDLESLLDSLPERAKHVVSCFRIMLGVMKASTHFSCANLTLAIQVANESLNLIRSDEELERMAAAHLPVAVSLLHDACYLAIRGNHLGLFHKTITHVSKLACGWPPGVPVALGLIQQANDSNMDYDEAIIGDILTKLGNTPVCLKKDLIVGWMLLGNCTTYVSCIKNLEKQKEEPSLLAPLSVPNMTVPAEVDQTKTQSVNCSNTKQPVEVHSPSSRAPSSPSIQLEDFAAQFLTPPQQSPLSNHNTLDDNLKNHQFLNSEEQVLHQLDLPDHALLTPQGGDLPNLFEYTGLGDDTQDKFGFTL